MTIFTTLFIILMCIAAYHHVGYPLLLKCVAGKKQKPNQKKAFEKINKRGNDKVKKKPRNQSWLHFHRKQQEEK